MDLLGLIPFTAEGRRGVFQQILTRRWSATITFLSWTVSLGRFLPGHVWVPSGLLL